MSIFCFDFDIDTVGGKDVNIEMVKAEHAEVYRGKPPKGFDIGPYMKAEAEAKKSGKSKWPLGGKYISPKNWRRMKK